MRKPHPPPKWAEFPNLRFRPARRAPGNGRIHRAIARAFMVHGDELTTAQALDWALPRVRRDGWRQRHRWSVVRVLRQVADPIHRVPPHGAWLWKLRTDDD